MGIGAGDHRDFVGAGELLSQQVTWKNRARVQDFDSVKLRFKYQVRVAEGSERVGCDSDPPLVFYFFHGFGRGESFPDEVAYP
jgi:hypothetical protein